MRWAWAAIDAVMTSAGHQPRWPDMTAQAAASAARKNVMPNQGFQLGVTATSGIHTIRPRMSPLAHSPPAGAEYRPGGLDRERAGHQAADDRSPEHPVHGVEMNRDGQQPVLQRARVENPVSQPGGLADHRAVRGQRVPGPQGDGRLVADRAPAVPDEPGRAEDERQPRGQVRDYAEHSLAPRTAEPRTAEHGRSADFQQGLLRFGPSSTRSGRNHGGRGHFIASATFARTEPVLIGDIPTKARFPAAKSNRKVNAAQ